MIVLYYLMRTFRYFLFLLSLALLSGIAGAQAPLAAFGGTPVSGASPLTVAFTDSSTGQSDRMGMVFRR